MRQLLLVAILAPLITLSACGGEERKTVIVNPPPAAGTVVVPPGSQTKVCPQGATVC
jgi:hypothetical protein